MKAGWVWILVVVILVGSIGGMLWYRNQQAQTQDEAVLRTASVERGSLEITVSASGNVAANQRADLRFDMSGTVDEVYVEVGGRVREGQVLARLETNELERKVRQSEIALEQAELDLKELREPAREEDIQLARATLNQASQALEVARIGKESAQSESQEMMRKAQEDRDKALQNYNDAKDMDAPWTEQSRLAYLEAEGQRGITQVDAELKLQQSQDNWLSAYNRYLEAQDNLKRLEEEPDADEVQRLALHVEQAKLTLEQDQEVLDEATLKATFGGVVAEVNVQQDLQSPTERPAVILVDDSAFYIDITVDETDISKVSPGMYVAVTLDAYPDLELVGEVESIAPAPTDTGGVVAYPVQVRLDDSGEATVRDGMTASVIIQTSKLEDVLLIPNWAARTDQTTGETYAYVYNSLTGSGERVTISLGARNESFTQVLSGLEEGETVALVAEERNLLEFRGPPSG